MKGYVKVFETPTDYVYSRETYKQLKLIDEGKNSVTITGRNTIGKLLLFWDTEYPNGGVQSAKWGMDEINLKDSGGSIFYRSNISDQFISGAKVTGIFFVPSHYPETQPVTIYSVSCTPAEKSFSTPINKTSDFGLIFEWEITITG